MKKRVSFLLMLLMVMSILLPTVAFAQEDEHYGPPPEILAKINSGELKVIDDFVLVSESPNLTDQDLGKLRSGIPIIKESRYASLSTGEEFTSYQQYTTTQATGDSLKFLLTSGVSNSTGNRKGTYYLDVEYNYATRKFSSVNNITPPYTATSCEAYVLTGVLQNNKSEVRQRTYFGYQSGSNYWIMGQTTVWSGGASKPNLTSYSFKESL